MTIRGDKDPKAELVGRVRRFVAEEVAPRAARIDRENAFPADLYRRMGQEGLLGLARPQGAGKTTLEWAATLRDAGFRHTKESAMAKLRASDVAMKVTVEALQKHGASSYSRSLPLERYVRDAKLTQIYEGTNQIQREVLARQLLG